MKAEQKSKQKQEKLEKPVKIKHKESDEPESLIRVMGYDIPGSKNLYVGLTRIKGISWAISNFVCLKLGYNRATKLSEISKDELKKIEAFLKALPAYDFMKNRRFDPETAESSHFYGTDLDFKKQFDIKRLRKIKSYKGLRHALKLPVRGQKTRSHFRNKGRSRAVGVKRKND